jgi:hypothetical protein
MLPENTKVTTFGNYGEIMEAGERCIMKRF